MKRTSLTKYIYKKRDGYVITKSIKGKNTYFKLCKTLDEAIKYRDQLIKNNWKPLPETPEEKYQREQEYYYRNVTVDKNKTYRIGNNKKYYGCTRTLEEALYYRDLVIRQGIRKEVKELDLKTNNPYLKEGLKYNIPERLQPVFEEKRYGKGSIIRKGPASFHVHHGKKPSHICSCKTIEMAEYVQKKMIECNWDKKQLPRILDEYPKYYTELLYFYQYILKQTDKEGNHTGKWLVSIPKEYSDGKLERIIYSNLEDALYERDFLKEHNWDYNLLVETINDKENPYYNMDLPTYPTRKIRNIRDRDYHEKELTRIIELLREGYNQTSICEMLDINHGNIRNWLKKYYNSNWTDFVDLVDDGENPLEVLEKVEVVYQPDLSKPLPPNFNNYVSRLNTPYGVRYVVQRKGVHYGRYTSEELAHKISRDLRKVNWDKSKLKQIQAKYGWQSLMNSKRWVYPNKSNSWSVRHKDKDRCMINYGTYRDKRVANIVRDMLLLVDWDKDKLESIKEVAYWIIYCSDLCQCSMFGMSSIEDIEYIEEECRIPHTSLTKYPDKLVVTKSINGKIVYFGTYSENKAREVVEFLEDNNWDKDLLKTMQEMGEI